MALMRRGQEDHGYADPIRRDFSLSVLQINYIWTHFGAELSFEPVLSYQGMVECD